MGLSGPRKRSKISHDPNNTNWSRSTDNFGHKILTAQGWSPGEYLGAKNAYHADLHTAANASHIRVALKDDNLGLGAKKGSGQAEGDCTGLDAFQGLLGRLNGKTEDIIQQEQKTRADLRRNLYVDQRWGAMNFVPGGLLVGDKIKDLTISDVEEQQEEVAEEELSAKKPSKGKKERKDKTSGPSKKKRRKSPVEADDNLDTSTTVTPRAEDSNAEESGNRNLKAIEKAAKKQRKLERRTKKEEKRRKAEALEAAPTIEGDSSVEEEEKAVVVSLPVGGQRHAVRQRFIRQKRLATMDPQSLKEIFMMKA